MCSPHTTNLDVKMRLPKATKKPEEIPAPKTPKKKKRRQTKKPRAVPPRQTTQLPDEDRLRLTPTESLDFKAALLRDSDDIPLDLTLPTTPRPESGQLFPIPEQDVVTTLEETTTPPASEPPDADAFFLRTRRFRNPLYGPLLTKPQITNKINLDLNSEERYLETLIPSILEKYTPTRFLIDESVFRRLPLFLEVGRDHCRPAIFLRNYLHWTAHHWQAGSAADFSLALRGRALEWFHSIPARGGDTNDWTYIQGLFIVEFVLDDAGWLSRADKRYYHTSGRNPPSDPSPGSSLLANDLAWLRKPPPRGTDAEAFHGATGIHRLSQLRELLNLIHDQHIKIPNPDTTLEKKFDKDPIGRHWKPPKFDPTPDELLQGIYESLLQMQHKVFPRREFPRLRTMPNFTAALLRDPDLIPISSPRGFSNNATPNQENHKPNPTC